MYLLVNVAGVCTNGGQSSFKLSCSFSSRLLTDCCLLLLPQDLGKYSEQALTRKVMRRVAAKLAMDEVARCLEGVRNQSATLQQHQHGDPLLAGGSRLW